MVVDINGKKGLIADLHIHSRFSRACSKELNIDNLEKWGRIKGLDLIGTGDFTHPVWLQELKERLIEDGSGILKTKSGFKFVLSSEVSLIYSQGGRGKKVHLVLLAPDFETVDKINSWLDKKGRRDYDGRPIFGISCEAFMAKMKIIDDRIEIMPSHAWTPYFGIFGSQSGFDSLREAFSSQADKINAIETGISSDPEMNWKISELLEKNISIVSFSDSHSFYPWRLGREATLFKEFYTYKELIRQIRENDIIGTVEVPPEYGKYHFDGHSQCNFSCLPRKTEELSGICPKCGKELTIGVENRVEKLSSLNEKNQEEYNKKMFFSILPLHEIISLYLGKGINTKTVWQTYNKLVEKFGNEFKVLLEVPYDKLAGIVNKNLAFLIIKNRQRGIKISPGFDCRYGKAILNDGLENSEKFKDDKSSNAREKQSTLV